MVHLCRSMLIVAVFCCSDTTPQLIINVKNQGGDLLQETISSNVIEDVITLEFQRPDGTVVTQAIDFKSEVQIFRLLILGEEERGQSQYQVVCFVTRLPKNEFISTDAMSKLRQRNPGAIRQPEDDRGTEFLEMDLSVDLSKSSIISPHLRHICEEAPNTTYAREADLRAWATPKALNRDIVSLISSVRRVSTSKPARCNVEPSWNQPCQCQLDLCVGWYPCGLKYCRGKELSASKSYRCGIKTCRKCRTFEFYSSRRHSCSWDLGQEASSNSIQQQPQTAA